MTPASSRPCFRRDRGARALVVTSPPYGPSVHGQVTAEQRHGAAAGSASTTTATATTRPTSPAGDWTISRGVHPGPGRLRRAAAPRRAGRGHRPALAPHGELVDLPAAVLAAGAEAGLLPVARCVALLAGLRGGQPIARPSLPARQPPQGPPPRPALAPDRARGRADLPQPKSRRQQPYPPQPAARSAPPGFRAASPGGVTYGSPPAAEPAGRCVLAGPATRVPGWPGPAAQGDRRCLAPGRASSLASFPG